MSSTESALEDTRTSQTDSKPGMGAIPHADGVAFRVWAPHADSVSVIGTFNEWKEDAHAMRPEGDGKWYIDVPAVKFGDEYKYLISNGDQKLHRNDPYARQVTNSVGNSVVAEVGFDWTGDDFQIADWNRLVIYEMHVGTFHRGDNERQVGTFNDVRQKLDYLQWLGVNAIQIMPVAEFAGDLSWGYNPAHIFAVEGAYGGPVELKKLVKHAHERGIAVIVDVVYNHFGPSDLDLWQFDGWSENDKGGIYFYNDWRSETPWGDSRPDYGRDEVRQFIFDNAMMWLHEYHFDGLRFDMTLYIRTVGGSEDTSIPEGWSLAQWINREIRNRFPRAITIAEDLRTNAAITADAEHGGAGFSTQWDEAFVHPVREAALVAADEDRDMNSVADAVSHRYNIDSFERVIYSESHDEVANGQQRLPSEIHQADPDSCYARRRSGLAAVLVFTAPGIPMIFQGQEFLEDKWFETDDPVDWNAADEQHPVLALYRDLIRLRQNAEGVTEGLTGQHVDVRHVNDADKVIAFHRWKEGGATDDVIVIANFAQKEHDEYRIGVPAPGVWKVRFDSAANVYGDDFDGSGIAEVEAADRGHDGCDHSILVPLKSYSALILSQDE